MSVINISLMDNVTNPMGIYTAVDTWANNLLSYSILTIIFMIALIVTINRGYKLVSCLAFSFTALLLPSFLFWVGGVLPPTLLIINIVMLAVSLFMVKFTEGK